MNERLKCPLCGNEFGVEEAQKGCRGCPLSPLCHKLRCPNCGYEMFKPIKATGSTRARRAKGYQYEEKCL